jgi:hypothetical protein
MICREFGCTPDDAYELDEELTMQVLQARRAGRAAAAFDAKGVDQTDAQRETYRRMLDALDARDVRRGIPEEL